MTVVERLASALGRNDEVPNVDLALMIAESKDKAAVNELVVALKGPDRALQSDAIKVLYEIGMIDPALIASHARQFVELLTSPQNRLVWGAMTALGVIAPTRGEKLAPYIPNIIAATQSGSVITQDWGVRVLAWVAARDKERRSDVAPFLTNFLTGCRAKDLPRHAVSCLILAEADEQFQASLLSTIHARRGELSQAQFRRIRAAVKHLE